MTIKETHEKAMAQVAVLRHDNKYEEASDLMRLSCCTHLELLNLDGIKEQGISRFYNVGNILLSSSEEFGKREDQGESYVIWNKRTKDSLKEHYKCKLTGEYCVSRREGLHHSEIIEGDSNHVIASLDIQIRCPLFKFREGLLEKLDDSKR